MYKCAILSLLIASSAVSAQTLDRSKMYAELDAMYFSSPGDFNGEQTMGLTLGYSPGKKHSVELELQVNGLDSKVYGFEVDADLVTYLVGYRYNFSEFNKLTYFGVRVWATVMRNLHRCHHHSGTESHHLVCKNWA